MANEAVRIDGGPTNIMDFTVNDNISIAKGTILHLVTPRTVSGASRVGQPPIAGIAAVAKTANDGATNLACHRVGIFKCLAGAAAIKLGDTVVLSGVNTVASGQGTGGVLSGASILGVALEDIAGAATGEIAVNL